MISPMPMRSGIRIFEGEMSWRSCASVKADMNQTPVPQEARGVATVSIWVFERLQLTTFYLVPERKPGFFVKVKDGENFNHRNTERILRIKI